MKKKPVRHYASATGWLKLPGRTKNFVVSPVELKAVKYLWKRKEASTAAEVQTGALVQTGSENAYTTVRTLLDGLEKKGILGSKRVRGRVYYFSQTGIRPDKASPAHFSGLLKLSEYY